MTRPLNCPKNKFRVGAKLEKILDECKIKNREITLMAYFNFPIINWQNKKINGVTKSEQDRAKLLLDLL